MKKILLVLIGVSVIACSDKVISKEYYRAHLDEAKQEITNCKISKDENATNCENALFAIQKEASRQDDIKVANNLRAKTRNVNDVFH